jgi:hypothetical protein
VVEAKSLYQRKEFQSESSIRKKALKNRRLRQFWENGQARIAVNRSRFLPKENRRDTRKGCKAIRCFNPAPHK